MEEREREKERGKKMAEGQGGLNDCYDKKCYCYQAQAQRLHSPATGNSAVKIIKNRGCFRCSISLVCYSYSHLYGCFWVKLKYRVLVGVPITATASYI